MSGRAPWARLLAGCRRRWARHPSGFRYADRRAGRSVRLTTKVSSARVDSAPLPSAGLVEHLRTQQTKLFPPRPARAEGDGSCLLLLVRFRMRNLPAHRAYFVDCKWVPGLHANHPKGATGSGMEVRGKNGGEWASAGRPTGSGRSFLSRSHERLRAAAAFSPQPSDAFASRLPVGPDWFSLTVSCDGVLAMVSKVVTTRAWLHTCAGRD